MTSLTTGGGPLESTEVGISSLMDVWLLLRDQEENGERNRLLYVLKARGIHHSNQVREFKLTSQGIDLVDVYLGAEGVATGTARAVQEAKEVAEAQARQHTIQRRQQEIERKRLVMEAQITALKAEFALEKDDLEQMIQQDQERESQMLQSTTGTGQAERGSRLNFGITLSFADDHSYTAMTSSSHSSENHDPNRALFPPEAQDVADYLEGF